MLIWKCFQADIYIILILQTVFQNIKLQDTAASVESDSADQTSEDAETAADIQNDQTIDTEGIYD